MSLAPLVFVNIGWMNKYAGASPDDRATGGHGFLKTNDVGHESWNFQPYRGRVYGYIPRSGSFNLTRLGAEKSAPSVDGVTVVWVARNPSDLKTYIVGWYQNATLLAPSEDIELTRGGFKVGYQVHVAKDDATLLKVEQRLFPVPMSKEPGNFGRYPVWYGGIGDEYRDSVRAYIKAGGVLPKPKAPGKGRTARNPDPEDRKRIEDAAVEHATAFYESAAGGNRNVKSVEHLNHGWDLTVTAPTGAIIKVEVKGLSGRAVAAEVTANEYTQMLSSEHREQYVVYIVTEAGTPEAESHIFVYSKGHSRRREHVWATAEGRKLLIKEVKAARLTAAPSAQRRQD
ncbi:MAG: hypothetical protein DI534_15715 [Leifsonia xyli]|nr:MAG: hypothetical protein DI534_15715 [Leifsonia xyli]